MRCLEEADPQKSDELHMAELFTEEESPRFCRSAAKLSHSAVPAIAGTILCPPDY